jgi:antirestriction protein ArdC
MKADVYQLVTDRIIARLEAGCIPWKHFASSPLSQPMNLVSKRIYHGINYLLLSHSRFSSPYWLTFNQAQELNGHVRKGERAEVVIFWKWLEVEDKETGEIKEIPFLRYYHVFNVEQTHKLTTDQRPTQFICSSGIVASPTSDFMKQSFMS